jgi:hypothetical protein
MCQLYSLTMALWGLKHVAVTHANKVVLINKCTLVGFLYEMVISLHGNEQDKASLIFFVYRSDDITRG